VISTFPDLAHFAPELAALAVFGVVNVNPKTINE
jgi:hypothetical protein